MATEESCCFSSFYLSILHNVYALEKVGSQNEQCSTLYCMAVCTLKIFTLQIKQIENILMSLLSKCLIFDTWLHMSKLEVNFLRVPVWSLQGNWVSHSDWSRKHNSHPSGKTAFFSSEYIRNSCFFFGSVSVPRYFKLEMVLLVRKQTGRKGREVSSEVEICEEDNWVKSGCVKLGRFKNISEH